LPIENAVFVCWNCYYQALTEYKYYIFSRDESYLNFNDKYIWEKDEKHRRKPNTTFPILLCRYWGSNYAKCWRGRAIAEASEILKTPL